MSYRATNWAYDLPLVGSQKFVLVALADLSDEVNSCYPGLEKLAGMTGLSVATVRRGLQRLEAGGLITHERRHRSNGSRTSNRYHLTVGMTLPEPLPLTSPSAHPAFKAPCNDLALTVQIPSAHGDRGKEPSVEPPVEPLDSAKGSKRKTALSDSWAPSEKNVTFAKANGIDLQHEVGQFRAHAEANDKRQSNWDAAFRLWLGNVVKWRKPEAPAKRDPNAWMNL